MKEEQQKNEECESCVHCTPELYTVEVDIEFIDKFLEIYKIIKEKLPDEYALGWKELAEEYRLKAIRNKDKITPPHRDKDEVRL